MHQYPCTFGGQPCRTKGQTAEARVPSVRRQCAGVMQKMHKTVIPTGMERNCGADTEKNALCARLRQHRAFSFSPFPI